MELLVSSPNSYSHGLWLGSAPLSSSHKCRLLSSSLLSMSRRSSSPLSYMHRKLVVSSSPSLSSSDNKYDSFFPCYDLDYLSVNIDWHLSRGDIELDSLSDDNDGGGGGGSGGGGVSNVDARLDEIIDKHRVKCSIGFGEYERNPHYGYGLDDDDDVNEPFVIQEGDHFDVISFLSTHSDDLVRVAPKNIKSTNFVKAHNLRGKYVLVCCAFVPSLWNDCESSLWRKLSLLASELSQTEIGGMFEIVIIPKMRKKWDNDEGVVHHLFTAFLGCLAVPFTHKFRRDYLCKALNFDGKPSYVLVDPSLKVLQVDSTDIFRYGARGFPFTHKQLTPLHQEDCWRSQPCAPSNKSLAGLLGCQSKPSSSVLRKFDSEETISVEQLNKNHVGLYLFKTGDMFREFDLIYKQCKSQGFDFEIVLICLPDDTGVHPVDFQDIVLSAMRKHGVSDWWLFPYNSACLKLENLSNSCWYNYDSMIIVGPHNKFVDRQGSKVIHLYGLHFGTEAYPFTMEALVQAFLQRMDKITLESFLTCDYVYRDYDCDESKRMCVSELKGKNVIVYVDYPADLCLKWERRSNCDDTLLPWYNTIKEKDPNFEVVYVPVYSKSEGVSKVRESISESKTKWLVCLSEDANKLSQLLNNDAFIFLTGYTLPKKGLPIPSVLAFGEDGHLHSIDAQRLLYNHGLDAYPFLSESRNLNLRDEISRTLVEEFELSDDTTLSL